ncbi:unnamed protein product, partial [Prorocentrum cordatum]
FPLHLIPPPIMSVPTTQRPPTNALPKLHASDSRETASRLRRRQASQPSGKPAQPAEQAWSPAMHSEGGGRPPRAKPCRRSGELRAGSGGRRSPVGPCGAGKEQAAAREGEEGRK